MELAFNQEISVVPGKRFADLLQGEQMIAHIGERVLNHFGRERDEFTRVGGAGAVAHMALMSLLLCQDNASSNRDGYHRQGYPI